MDRRYKHYIISFLIQISIAGFFLHPWDGFVFLRSVQDFLNGVTPYETRASHAPYIAISNGDSWWAYPPLQLLIFTSTYAPYYYFLGHNPILGRIFLKLCLILGNLLCAYLVYRLVAGVSSQKKASKAEKLVLYNPFLIFIGAAWGMFDIWMVNFLLLCLLRLRQGRIVKAGVYLALSLLVKPISVVFIPMLIAYIWNKTRGIAKPIAFACAAVVTSLIVCLPFFIISPGGFIGGVIGEHASRPPGGCAPIAILYLGKVLHDMRSFRIPYLPLPALSALSLALIATVSVLLFLYLRLRREEQEKELLAALFLTMVFFTLSNKVVSPQYFVTLVVLSLLVLYAYDGYELLRRSLVKKYYLSLVIPLLLAQLFDGRQFLLFIPPDIATWLFGRTADQLDAQFAQSFPVSPDFYHLAFQFAFGILIIPTIALALAIAFPCLKKVIVTISRHLTNSVPRTWLAERRQTLQKSFAVLIALSLLAVPASAAAAAYDTGEQRPHVPDALGARSVGVFYYLWWENSSCDPNRLYDNWTKSVLTPADGYYQPNIEYIKEDIGQMKQAGIDFAVVSVPEHQIDTETYAAFVNCSEEEGFYFAPMIEAYDLHIDRPQVGARPLQPREKLEDKITSRIHTALNRKNSTSFLRFDGKPVVFVHTHPYFPAKADSALDQAFWSRIQQEVEVKEGALFWVADVGPGEDIGPFDAGFYLPQLSWQGTETNENAIEKWEAKMKDLPSTKGSRSIATVMPYYNDLKINPSGREIPKDLDGQSTYDLFWQIAMEGQSDIVLIFSWNEYFESSCIEPTKEFGDEFLQRTQFWTDQFKKT